MKVGIKCGVFSLIHAGHIQCIQDCRKYCDYLILLTNEDKYVMNKKGCVPIELDDRKYILEHIKGVDEVHSYEGFNEHFWVATFKSFRLHEEFGADAKLVMLHTAELKNEIWVPGRNIADEIVFIERTERRASVSEIFEKIRKSK